MEQIRQIGEALGSINALMVFRDEIKINQRQCFLLVDAFNLAFEGIAEEMRQNLKFDEKLTKWKALEHPLRELLRVFREGEQYIRQCMETKDWWVKAITLSRNTDCIEFHLHNLLCCIPVVIEAIENVGEISGYDQDEIQKKRVILSKKYEKDWMDPKLFQHKFGKQHLVSQELCSRIELVFKEDKWILMDTVSEKQSSGSLTKQENRLAELLTSSSGKLLPSSILVGSKDYQVRQRLGNGSHYKEVQWLGESFAVRHFFGDIEPLVPEISHLSSLTHSNIVHFMCSFSDEEKKECFLVMELMNKDLGNYIKEICGPRRRIPFTLPVAVDIMLQIARGMEYLHSHKMYHGNLDPSHILVKARNSCPDGYLHVKVAGFGLSSVRNCKTPLNQTSTNPCIWYAPEVLLEQEQPGRPRTLKYSEKADVYSFGMLCFELLTGKVPFDDGHLQGDKMSRNIRAGERPLFPFPSPKYLTSLTKRCWHTDPSQRPSFSSICRILRYIKRFLIMNPDHSQPDPTLPPVDYLDIETSLSKRFTWTATESMPVLNVPFQMFAYKVIEREKTNVNFKDKSSESGSEGASVCGEDNGFTTALTEDPFSTPVVSSSSSSYQVSSESTKKMSAKKSANGKADKQSGKQQKVRTERPPQTTPTGRSLRMNSESQLQQVVLSPGRRKTSGHASDSELA